MFWKLVVANTIAIITVTIIIVCIIIGRFLYTMTESERLCLMQHYWQHFATSLEGSFIRSIRLCNQTLFPLNDNHKKYHHHHHCVQRYHWSVPLYDDRSAASVVQLCLFLHHHLHFPWQVFWKFSVFLTITFLIQLDLIKSIALLSSTYTLTGSFKVIGIIKNYVFDSIRY